MLNVSKSMKMAAKYYLMITVKRKYTFTLIRILFSFFYNEFVKNAIEEASYFYNRRWEHHSLALYSSPHRYRLAF